MKITFNQLWDHTTNLDNSPLLNGTKAAGRVVQSKAGKPLVTAALLLGSTVLSTGVIPIKGQIAGQQITNTKRANALGCQPKSQYVWWAATIYLNDCAAREIGDIGNQASIVGGLASLAVSGPMAPVFAAGLAYYSNVAKYCGERNYGVTMRYSYWGPSYNKFQIGCRSNF